MFSLDENPGSANHVSLQKLQTLIVGRLIVVFLLLVTSWIWYSGSIRFTLDNFPEGPLVVFVISVGLTAVYFLLSRISRSTDWQVRAQFVIDAMLITWLVWKTGDLTSPNITLYTVLIGVSSAFLRPRATFMMAVICVAFFALLAGLTSFAVIEPSGAALTGSRTVQIVSFHTIAFLVVGLLASRLSERLTSGEQLKEATKTLANLQALHERIIESIRSGLITTDLDGMIYTFNASASEITGYNAEEMRGRSIFSLFGNIRQPIALSLNAQDGETLPRFETDLMTPEGFAVHIGYNISPLFSEDNERTGLIVTFQDLTEIRSMEESIKRKDRLAAVGRVGAGLAHEIRNPLGAMRGAIQVLESNTPPESVQADLMHIILRESDRLNSIITNFLSYAKPKIGSFTEIDACEAIRETVKLLRHSPEVTDKHKINEKLAPTPLFVSADATQLKQVFWNLARNSINAMPEGGELSITLEALANNRVQIMFEDTGVGMTPEQVERLFEPFSNSTSGGTGLGLSIVYQIIRDHDGIINVRSFEREGTVITVVLPRAPSVTNVSGNDEDIHLSTEPTPIKEYLTVKNKDSEISS
ncbi:MAG TPA: ATP-binding protein [Pyrinomonadaceae bacterium]|nr:ATP-binding protein [Pyrinomonadaceae bacterium]